MIGLISKRKADSPESLLATVLNIAAPQADDILHLTSTSKECVFPYKGGLEIHYLTPLPSNVFDCFLVDGTIDLPSHAYAADFIAHLNSSLRKDGQIYIATTLFEHASSSSSPDIADIVKRIAATLQRGKEHFVIRKGSASPDPLSPLGYFYKNREAIVCNCILGACAIGGNGKLVKSMLSEITYPGQDNFGSYRRLDAGSSAQIVDYVRSGRTGDIRTMILPEPSMPSLKWSWKTFPELFNTHLQSWQTYLIPGNAYKAKIVSRIIKETYPSRTDVSFLEHGGNAGLLSAQILLEQDPPIKLAVCCDIDLIPLINALYLYKHFEDKLRGRFQIGNVSAEDMSYRRQFTVIAFIHTMVYFRRDRLNSILKKAWDGLEPGGLIISFENTVPPSRKEGKDAPIIFMREELDEYLAAFGPIAFYDPVRGNRLDPSNVKSQAFRVMKKP